MDNDCVESFHAEAGETRDKVGPAVGMSGKTYEKAKAVVAAAEESPEEFGDLVFHEDDLDELQAALEGLVRALGTTKLHTTSLPFLAGITDLYRRPPKTRRCYAGYAACAVNPQGRVGPCSDMLSQFSVREKPLEEIWASPGFHELRERVRQCDEACWDTTNAELSLRLQLRNWASSGGIGYIWRDLKFYFGGHRA